MIVTRINHCRLFLGTAAVIFFAGLTGLASILAAEPPAILAPKYQITRTLVDENGEAVTQSRFKNSENSKGSGTPNVQLHNGSDPHLRWKFTLNWPVTQGESVLLIQRVSERMSPGSGSNTTTAYYEVIGTVNEGATQIASQPFDDMWCLSRNQNFAQWRPISIAAEVRAFRVTPALTAVIATLFYDPKDHANQPIWHSGQQSQVASVEFAKSTAPPLTPGTLLSIKNFNDELRPDRSAPAVNYWRDQAIGAEALNGKWAYETVTGTFSRGDCTAHGITARENLYRELTAPALLVRH
jgi:hypothetical protein